MTPPERSELDARLRDSAREIAHELKNQIGIAGGSAELLLLQFEAAMRAPYSPGEQGADEAVAAELRDLGEPAGPAPASGEEALPGEEVLAEPAAAAEGHDEAGPRGELDWEQAHRHLGRILRALERMTAYVTLTQRLLREQSESPSQFDLAELLEQLARDLAQLSEANESRLALRCRPELDYRVRAPRDDLLGLIGRLMTLIPGWPLTATLELDGAVRLHLEGDVDGRGEVTGGGERPPMPDSFWSLPGERLRLRVWGGDLHWEPHRVTLTLPLAHASANAGSGPWGGHAPPAPVSRGEASRGEASRGEASRGEGRRGREGFGEAEAGG